MGRVTKQYGKDELEDRPHNTKLQTPLLPSLKATRVVGGGHRRHHHHHVILGFSMIGPNETLGPPRTVAARLCATFRPWLGES